MIAHMYVKPRLWGTHCVPLKDWPEANWQSFIFGNREKCFHTSQTAKTISSFTVICLVDAREGSFPFRSRLRRSFQVLPIGGTLAETRGSLEGVRGRGLNMIAGCGACTFVAAGATAAAVGLREPTLVVDYPSRLFWHSSLRRRRSSLPAYPTPSYWDRPTHRPVRHKPHVSYVNLYLLSWSWGASASCSLCHGRRFPLHLSHTRSLITYS
jgi:hypothetical protein